MDNDNFWTDELVAEYSLASKVLTMWEFKRVKAKKEEEKPKVNHAGWDSERFSFWIGKMGRDDKMVEVSRERLAEILLAESKGKYFTEKEILEAEEKEFKAAKGVYS